MEGSAEVSHRAGGAWQGAVEASKKRDLDLRLEEMDCRDLPHRIQQRHQLAYHALIFCSILDSGSTGEQEKDQVDAAFFLSMDRGRSSTVRTQPAAHSIAPRDLHELRQSVISRLNAAQVPCLAFRRANLSLDRVETDPLGIHCD